MVYNTSVHVPPHLMEPLHLELDLLVEADYPDLRGGRISLAANTPAAILGRASWQRRHIDDHRRKGHAE